MLPEVADKMADPLITPAAPEIPDKLYFRIGEVSRLAGVKPFVLRFWESEFPQLAPKKSGTGHRLYRRKEVETVLEIKRLLYDERFTIEGARNYLQSKAASPQAKAAPRNKKQKAVAAPVQGDLFGGGVPVSAIEELRKELQSILELLR